MHIGAAWAGNLTLAGADRELKNEEREDWTRCKGFMRISIQARDIPHTEKAEKTTATCCKSHERQQRTQEYGVL